MWLRLQFRCYSHKCAFVGFRPKITLVHTQQICHPRHYPGHQAFLFWLEMVNIFITPECLLLKSVTIQRLSQQKGIIAPNRIYKLLNPVVFLTCLTTTTNISKCENCKLSCFRVCVSVVQQNWPLRSRWRRCASLCWLRLVMLSADPWVQLQQSTSSWSSLDITWLRLSRNCKTICIYMETHLKTLYYISVL